ncbi:MAG: penicillin-binding protein activator [Deltaproteobacteria bacterium]|nr:penicillin-binding protein activator [Deltaproteobacteria bacterium]MBW2596371.1 penicillin-binding protein activator [Deltaproteobacteria bacterium]
MKIPQKILCTLCAGLMLFAAGCAVVPVKKEVIRIVPEEMPAGAIEALTGDNLAKAGKNRAAFDWYMKSLKSGPDASLEKSVKKKVEGIIADKLSLHQLQEIKKGYWWRYPSGHLLYALARASYDMRDIEKATGYLDRFLSGYRSHPLFEKGEDLRRRIAAMELVNRYAVGCVLPLTGRYATYGSRALDAIILASGVFDPDRNSPIQLLIEDSKGDPVTARKAVRKLADEHHVIGIIGPLGSAAALEAAKEAQDLGVPIITLTQRKNIAERGDYVFRDFLTGDMQVKALVTYSIRNLGIENFAILYPDDNYGTEMMALFWDEVLRQGGQIRGVESYSDKQTDFGREIKSLTGLNFPEEDEASGENPKPTVDFDALFIPDSYSTVSMIAPQLTFYDVIGVQLLGTSIWNSPGLLKTNSEYLERAIFTDCFFLNSFYPEVRDFIDRFYVACSREPGNVEALAYDAAGIVVKLITERDIEIRDDLRDSISRIEDYPGITGTTSFSGTGDAEKPLHMLTVMDGEIVQIR